ncbi:MAG: hypothetical protein AB2556_24195 [Candidatus Thiodiazotropha sp.]
MPDVALVDVNLSTLGEVKVFGPSVAVVADEFYIYSTGPIFATVVDVLISNVPQDN